LLSQEEECRTSFLSGFIQKNRGGSFHFLKMRRLLAKTARSDREENGWSFEEGPLTSSIEEETPRLYLSSG
jgi:hypothetical protein